MQRQGVMEETPCWLLPHCVSGYTTVSPAFCPFPLSPLDEVGAGGLSLQGVCWKLLRKHGVVINVSNIWAPALVTGHKSNGRAVLLPAGHELCCFWEG